MITSILAATALDVSYMSNISYIHKHRSCDIASDGSPNTFVYEASYGACRASKMPRTKSQSRMGGKR